jgi:ABC-2 type transport system permease protein
MSELESDCRLPMEDCRLKNDPANGSSLAVGNRQSAIGNRLFQWLRWRLLCNTLHELVRRSPVRLITIFLCSALIWAGIFGLSWLGFSFLSIELKVRLNGNIIGTLLNLLFVVLSVLLMFSSGIILYSSLFSSDETGFLLSTPAPADQVFAFKYQGAVAFSSWAVILLGSPILIAYGLILEQTPWYYYVVLPLFFMGFVLLPGSVGAILCLLIVNYVPRRRKQVLILAGLLIAVALGWFIYRMVLVARGQFGTSDWVNQLLGEFSLFQGVLVPAHWVSQGLLKTVRDIPVKVCYYLALVWSNGLFLYVIAAWMAHRLYRRGYNRVATGGSIRRRYGGGWLDDVLSALLPWLAPQTRLLIIKDFRTFRRDPAQWAQILIFVGLASLYFTNVGRFQQQDISHTTQKNVISVLNLSATAFLLCAYTGRFIYPMLSLEGRKFWILGLLPLQRDRLLLGKFAFSAIGSLLIAEFVVIFSNLMLNAGWLTIGLHALTVVVLALGLSGLSVGLGASMPNFQERDPSKLAVGFGGTLNLVAGLLYLLFVIGVMVVPWHVHIALQGNELEMNAWTVGWLLGGMAAGIAVGIVAVVVPLRMGIRALRRMEF